MSSPNVVSIERPQQSEKAARRRPRNAGSFVHTIYQEDLEKERVLAKAIGDAKAAYRKHMEFLEQAHRAGAMIEPGLYDIKEVLRRGGGVEVQPWQKPGIRVVRKKAS